MAKKITRDPDGTERLREEDGRYAGQRRYGAAGNVNLGEIAIPIRRVTVKLQRAVRGEDGLVTADTVESDGCLVGPELRSASGWRSYSFALVHDAEAPELPGAPAQVARLVLVDTDTGDEAYEHLVVPGMKSPIMLHSSRVYATGKGIRISMPNARKRNPNRRFADQVDLESTKAGQRLYDQIRADVEAAAEEQPELVEPLDADGIRDQLGRKLSYEAATLNTAHLDTAIERYMEAGATREEAVEKALDALRAELLERR